MMKFKSGRWLVRIVGKIAKKYNATDFEGCNFYKHTFVRFTLPNNYRVVVSNWVGMKAEHVYYFGKLLPNDTLFEDEFECIDDIKMFIKIIAELENDEEYDRLYELERIKRGEGND